MAWRRIGSFTIPLLGITKQKALDAARKTFNFAKSTGLVVKKPGRELGAVWIDNYVNRGQNVVLCEECWRKYHGWWRRYGYRADWVGWWSHCDGCGRHVRCNCFYPEHRINEAVHPKFWRDDYKKYADFKPVH